MSGLGRHDGVGPEADAMSKAEPDEVRNARLIALQMEALGTPRKDRISTTDFKENRQPPNLKLIQQLRRINVPGTREHQESKQDRGQLSAWNNLYTSIEDDGTVDEGLLDFHGGQTHRAKLMQEVSGQHNQSSSESQRGSKSQRGGKAGSGGRGGGSHGYRGHSWGPKRTPAGHSQATSGANSSSAGSHSLHRGDPFARDDSRSGERSIKSTTSRAVPALAASRPSAPAVSRPNTPAARRPSAPSWGSGLASPEAFMAAIHQGQSTTPAATQGATPVVTETAPRPDAIANSENYTAANDEGQYTTPSVSEGATATVTVNVPGPDANVNGKAFMVADIQGQDITPAVSQDSENTVTETAMAPAAIANPEDTRGKPNHPSHMEVIDEVSDVLISTDAGSSHGSLYSMAPSSGVDRRPSYSNDLIGLEMDSVPSSSLVVGVGSSDSAEEHNRKASDATDRAYNPIIDLLNEIENLIPTLLRVADRVPIKRQIDELFAQVKANVAGSYSSSSFNDTELNKPMPQTPAESTPQDQPKEILEEIKSEAQFFGTTTLPAQVQSLHIESSKKGKERVSEGGKTSEEVAASGPPVETDIHHGVVHRDEADLTTGGHITQGQFSRSSISSSSEATQKATFVAPTVLSPLDSSVGPLAAGFARLSLENTSRREAAPKLAKVNPFNSVASGTNESHSSKTELPSSKPLIQESPSNLQRMEAASNAPVSIRSQSSESRDAFSIIPALKPRLTGSDGSELGQAPQMPLQKPPFFVAAIPLPGGSRINRVGYFREENRSPGSTRRTTPEIPLQPIVAAISPPMGSMINRVGYFREENRSPGSTRRTSPEIQFQPNPATATFQPNAAAAVFRPKVSTAPFRPNMSTDTGRGGDTTPGVSLPSMQPAASTTMPNITTNAPASEHSVFKITHVPSGPSRLNRTGFLKENQQPTIKEVMRYA